MWIQGLLLLLSVVAQSQSYELLKISSEGEHPLAASKPLLAAIVHDDVVLYNCTLESPVSCSALGNLSLPENYTSAEYISFSGPILAVGSSLSPINGTETRAIFFFDCSSFPCSLEETIERENLPHFGASFSYSGSLLSAPYGSGEALVFNCSSFPCVQIANFSNLPVPSASTSRYPVSASNLLTAFGDYIYDCTAECVLKQTFNISYNTATPVAIDMMMVAMEVFNDIGDDYVYLFNCSSFPCIQIEAIQLELLQTMSNNQISLFWPYMSLIDRNSTVRVFDCSNSCVEIALIEEVSASSVVMSPELVLMGGFGYYTTGLSLLSYSSFFPLTLSHIYLAI